MSKQRMVDFTVRIPNFEGDGVQEAVTIKVPIEVDPVTGEELVTQEAVELIETTKTALGRGCL